MSKPFTNPFFEVDTSKILDLSKVTGDFRLPQFDFEAAVKLQKKNVETWTAVSQSVFETFKSLFQSQSELYRQNAEEFSRSISAIWSLPTPQEKVIKQAEISKLAVEKSLANLSEIAETISKCNAQAIETVSTRINEGLNELRDIVKSNRAA